MDKYGALLKDSKTGNFVEETLMNFFTNALSMFNTLHEIFITTDSYHYESVLSRVSVIVGKGINRQRRMLRTGSRKRGRRTNWMVQRNS